MPILLYPEGEMTLGEIADGDNKQDSDHLADKRVPMQHFHQQFEHTVVEYEVKAKGKEIPEQLYPAPQIGPGKNNVPVENEPHDKVHAAGQKESGNMWFKSIEPEIKYLPGKNIIVTNKI